MSTEGHSSVPGASIHENHYCCVDGCGKWGSFGFAPNKATPAMWWCGEHYPHWTAEEARRDARNAEEMK